LVYIFSMQHFNLFHSWVRICPGSQRTHICSWGHSSAAKIHPSYLAAFCVVEIKCKVLNVPFLLALMAVTSVSTDNVSNKCQIRGDVFG